MWRYNNVETLVSRGMFKVVYDVQHTKRALRSRSVFASVQSNLGIFCLLTYTTVSTDSVSGQQRTRSACRIVQADPGLAGLGGSVGCAVRLEARRSRVQPPPRSATLFRGD